MKQKTLLLSLMLLIGIGLSILLMVTYKFNGAQQTPHGVNAFMNNPLYQQYNQQGKLHTQIQAEQAQHEIRHNLTKYIKPKVLIYTASRIPWYITSDYGISEYIGSSINKNNNEKIYLYDHVVIHHPQRPNNPETTITTSTLTIYPHRSRAETDQFVTITRPDTHIHGKGMRANLKTGTIKLLKQSRGTYETSSPP